MSESDARGKQMTAQVIVLGPGPHDPWTRGRNPEGHQPGDRRLGRLPRGNQRPKSRDTAPYPPRLRRAVLRPKKGSSANQAGGSLCRWCITATSTHAVVRISDTRVDDPSETSIVEGWPNKALQRTRRTLVKVDSQVYTDERYCNRSGAKEAYHEGADCRR